MNDFEKFNIFLALKYDKININYHILMLKQLFNCIVDDLVENLKTIKKVIIMLILLKINY